MPSKPNIVDIQIITPKEGHLLIGPAVRVSGDITAQVWDEGSSEYLPARLQSVKVTFNGSQVPRVSVLGPSVLGEYWTWSCVGTVTAGGALTIRAKAITSAGNKAAECHVTVELPPEKPSCAWLRLEPRCRSNDFARGLQARTADPLWMLARQWQTGEFQGEDTGSPLEVHLRYATQSLDRVRLGETEELDLSGEPLEQMVEQEWPALDWWRRVQAGQEFERFLRSELAGDAQANSQRTILAYREHYALSLPTGSDWTSTDLATRRFLELMHGRVVDGGELLADVDLSDQDDHQVPALGGIEPAQLARVLHSFKVWCDRLNIRPYGRFLFRVEPAFKTDLETGSLSEAFREKFRDHRISLSEEADRITMASEVADKRWRIYDSGHDRMYLVVEHGQLQVFSAGKPVAWRGEQLNYRFAVNPSAGAQDKKLHLVAPGYRSGDLDWHAFNVAKVPAPQKQEWSKDTIKVIPTQIRIMGMSPRWWAFEDAALAIGQMDVAKPDLAKLILMEFILIYGDDWFGVPLPVRMSNLVRIEQMTVTNVFGEPPVPVKPARKPIQDALLRWEMFALSPIPDPTQPGIGDPDLPGVEASLLDGAKVPVLLVPPVAGLRQESKPLEEIQFLRDEGANMVWAVEHTVRDGLGRPVRGFDAQRERAERRSETTSGEAKDEQEAQPTSADTPPRYRLATVVPENWIPFIPINATAYLGYKGMRLRRAQMLRNTGDEAPCPIPAMSRLLELEGAPLLWLEEAVVPRAGLRVQLTAQRVRWFDGKTYVWLGRKVLAGRGEGSSGLRFDVLTD